MFFAHISLENRLNIHEKTQPYIFQYVLFRTEKNKSRLIPSLGCLAQWVVEGGSASPWL